MGGKGDWLALDRNSSDSGERSILDGVGIT